MFPYRCFLLALALLCLALPAAAPAFGHNPHERKGPSCINSAPAMWKELFERCPPQPDEFCTPENGPGPGCHCTISCVPHGNAANDCWRPQAICLRQPPGQEVSEFELVVEWPMVVVASAK
jgi:hypothetical protein